MEMRMIGAFGSTAPRRAQVARVSAQSLAQTLASQPELAPAILRNLGTVMMSGDPKLRDALAAYLADAARASAASSDLRRLTAIVVVDPLRYGTDAAFR